MDSIKIEQLLKDRDFDLRLELLAGESGLDRRVVSSRIQKPGLALSGFTEHIHKDRLQVFGNTEISYLATLRHDEALKRVRDLFRLPIACLVVTKNLPVEDFQHLVTYLTSLQTSPLGSGDQGQGAGGKTYVALCARCHGDKGDGNGKVALYLDPSPRDFTKTAFMSSKPRERFLKSVHEGVAGTSMPPWAKVLKPEQAEGVLNYVLTSFAVVGLEIAATAFAIINTQASFSFDRKNCETVIVLVFAERATGS